MYFGLQQPEPKSTSSIFTEPRGDQLDTKLKALRVDIDAVHKIFDTISSDSSNGSNVSHHLQISRIWFGNALNTLTHSSPYDSSNNSRKHHGTDTISEPTDTFTGDLSEIDAGETIIQITDFLVETLDGLIKRAKAIYDLTCERNVYDFWIIEHVLDGVKNLILAKNYIRMVGVESIQLKE